MSQSKPNQRKEQEQLRLDLGLGKRIEANFDGGRISSDGGILLLRKADDYLELTQTAIFCLRDTRRADLIDHTHAEMLRQRMYAMAHLYEDCNDAAYLRFDDMHKLAAGRLPSGAPLASQPTLSRFENAVDEVSLKALQQLLVHAYIRMLKRKLHPPKKLGLLIDTTCDKTHGYQQLTFYNGFYETDCYVPLHIFADDGFPLISLLRAGNAAPGEGALRMLKLVVDNLRLAFPRLQVEVLADAAFALPEIYDYCEASGITYYICIKGNAGLDYHAKELVAACKNEWDEVLGVVSLPLRYGRMNSKLVYLAWRQREERLRFSSKDQGRMQERDEQEHYVVRRFKEFEYDAREWPYKRRIIARVDYSNTGPDVRYVVTNRKGSTPSKIYQQYCLRSRCENWIKDLKNYLKSDRTSCQEFNANQFRLLVHTFAYALMWKLKQAAGLEDTTVESVRLQLLKVGVLVSENKRMIRMQLASQHPHQNAFVQAWNTLARAG